ncbi:NAD-dependent epimerase/dehydratase family protein [Mucilaginibacter sp.]|uniref:NAD-dependent epimerase/dehydratase family protein n=1 Tax=Mucilaginibacter sp. TaxID=1882438 RepID=UPI003B00BB29
MYIILGAGGPVANALTKELSAANEKVRLVSRKPIPTSGNTSWQKADLLNKDEVFSAVKEASVIYLCAGLKYDKKVWAAQWPVIIQNAIEAAKQTGARLIFFDNVYMYGLVKGKMTEETPYHPLSAKGEIRAKIATTLMDEVKAGNIRASILRAADFYGAGQSTNSVFDSLVLAKFAKKQSAMWLGNPKLLHAFTFVPDCGRALFLLGQNPQSNNQIWHAPTAPALTGKQLIELAAKVFQTEPKFNSINKLMLRLIGIFDKNSAGAVEMFYQYDHDYVFDSAKFETFFKVKPTSYETGIRELKDTLFKG